MKKFVLILLLLSGCASMQQNITNPYLSDDKIKKIEEEVRKKMSVPSWYHVKYNLRTRAWTSGEMGSWNYKTHTLYYDGSPGILAHELAHAYGADEERAQQIQMGFK